MVRVMLIAIGVTCATVAVVLSPDAPSSADAGDVFVLPPAAARTLALGRDAAGADIGWLFLVQLIGSSEAEQRAYPGLEKWLELINTLAPHFEVPYYSGAVLLATTAGRYDSALDVIERARDTFDPPFCSRRDLCATPTVYRDAGDYYAEHCQPCDALQACHVDTELWQGFVKYFGMGETAEAADHFCEARRRGGASYLSGLAARVASQARDCRRLATDLDELAGSGATGQDALLRSRVLPMVESCSRGELKRALSAFKLANGRSATDVRELVEEGFTENPIAPPGKCWSIASGRPELEPCR